MGHQLKIEHPTINMKAFIVLACVAAASAAGVPAYGAPAYHQPSYEEPAVYAYQYGVNDDYSGANYNADESRDGYSTKVSYSVNLPDRRVQTVTYNVADGYSGYVADVTYSGEAHYPEATAYKPAPYKPAPVYHAAPVYKAAPAYKPAPVYHAAPAPVYHASAPV